MFTIYQKLLEEQTRLTKELQKIEAQLSTLPEGKLICSKVTPTRYKWFLSDGHAKIYLSKKNHQLAQQLAAKKYLSLLREELLQEKCAIEFYLRHHDTSPSQAMQLLTEHPEFSKLLTTHFAPVSESLLKWANEEYIKNPTNPEQLIFPCPCGQNVRSKSESMIAQLLYTNQIPFRYECALQLGDVLLYPDFTIRHPCTGATYYWEHFGLMDNPNYCKNASSKIHLYSSHGIIPSIHLITTYETKEHPLTLETIRKVISEYFL